MSADPIVTRFAALVRRRPQAPLVVSPPRVARASEVADLADRVAELLDGAGLAAGAVVGLSAANGPGFLAALVALRRRRAAALLLDRGLRPPETAAAAATLGACGILEIARAWPSGREDLAWRPAGTPEPAAVDPEIAVIKLTSGSTGAPRGVLTPSGALLADEEALAATMGLGEEERIVAMVPMSHSYGLSSVALPALVRGAAAVVPGEAGPFSAFCAARQAAATFFPTVPAYLGALVRTACPPPFPQSVRLVISAGAPLAPETAERFRRFYARPVHAFYGASECGGICFDREGTAAERGTVGPPVEGVAVELLPDAGSPGCRGRLAVRSPAVACCYAPEPDARLSGGRFLTDDVAELRAGEVALVGRLGDLVNVRGRKVDPREVEGVIGALPAVEDVVVIGVAEKGGGETLRAVVACRPEALSRGELVAWCRSRLAAHKVPRSVVMVEELPRTARGKLDREALRSLPGTGR